MTTSFLCRSMDTQLKNFLDAEANLVLSKNQCQYCYDTKGCVYCKEMGNPASFVEHWMRSQKSRLQWWQIFLAIVSAPMFWIPNMSKRQKKKELNCEMASDNAKNSQQASHCTIIDGQGPSKVKSEWFKLQISLKFAASSKWGHVAQGSLSYLHFQVLKLVVLCMLTLRMDVITGMGSRILPNTW